MSAEPVAPPTTDDVLAGRDLAGRTALVTGATAGLGLETARALASAGAHVLLTGRDRVRLDSALATIRAAVPHAALVGVTLDLADLGSVRAAAAHVRATAERLDLLVNNAGVMFTPLTRTADGFELQLGTNHLGHHLLTRLLEPLLAPGPHGPARVVALSSAGHRLANVDLDDPHWERRPYDKFAAYGAAKTANVLFAVELDRRLRTRGVRAYAVHPGTVDTELARHMDADDFRQMAGLAAATAADRPNRRAARLRPTDVAHGAATQVWACVADELGEVGGAYLADCAVSDEVAPYAVDPDRAARLWRLSDELTGVGEATPPETRGDFR